MWLVTMVAKGHYLTLSGRMLPQYDPLRWDATFLIHTRSVQLSFSFFFSCPNRGMKRKRAYACHHRNEWVVVHSLVQACFIGSFAVRNRVRCSQWRPCQPPRQWWAPCSGMVSSAPHWLPAAISALCLNSGFFYLSIYLLLLLCRSLALIWDLDFISLMGKGRWITSFATNTRKDGDPSHVFPSHPMEAYHYRYRADGKQKESPVRLVHLPEIWRSQSSPRRRRL